MQHQLCSHLTNRCATAHTSLCTRLDASANMRTHIGNDTWAVLPSQERDATATEKALSMYRDQVRRCLNKEQGYECQANEGDFMLAFHEPTHAVEFCLSVSHCRIFQSI